MNNAHTTPPAAPPPRGGLPHALDRVEHWVRAWAHHGRLVLLLDFDGTLAPIVDRPEQARMPDETRVAVRRLLGCGADVAVVSGRGLADARERVAIAEIAYAGNHGMEIEGPDIHQVHPEAAAARPVLQRVAGEIGRDLQDVDGAIVEDKGLTLSIHFRLVSEADEDRVRNAVRAATADHRELRVTEGKKVLEVRPRVDWHKGRAVEFLLERLELPGGTPVLYIGDDRTDEDAFEALRQRSDGGGEGILVSGTPPGDSAAAAYVRSPAEVAELLDALADGAGCGPVR